MKRHAKAKKMDYEEDFQESSLPDLSADIDHNEQQLRTIFQNCSDVVYRKLRPNEQFEWLFVYFKSLVDEELLDELIIKPLTSEIDSEPKRNWNDIEFLNLRLIPVRQTVLTSKMTDIVQQTLQGNVAILTKTQSKAITFATKAKLERSIKEPPSEPIIRGSRDAFNESISTNVALLRSRLKTPRLKMESYTLGEFSQTAVLIAYLEDIATDSVVEEVRSRVSRIQIDGILESGYIEEFIEDLPFSPFPQIINTERPDVVAAGLLEGKVAILVDSTPFVLIVPMTFWSGLQASEDYYMRAISATAVRWVRFIFTFIALFAPSLYVGVTTYHQEMIPTHLLMSVAAAREPSPFPALIEALMMEITFEALREAGVRLPRPVGQAVSIVGALVIGQAAVQAGIVSAPMVIIVSMTGIASFIIPRYDFANGIRLLRFPMILLAGTLGLYGIALGFLGILLHVASLRSFGVPYFTPIAPLTLNGLKDVFVRVPRWNSHLRPRLTGARNPVRVPAGQKPKPHQGKPER